MTGRSAACRPLLIKQEDDAGAGYEKKGARGAGGWER